MRFVLKLGTSLLAGLDHRFDEDFLGEFVSEVARMKNKGHEMVIVSSGAVASGRAELALEREKHSIPFRQALAAVGQARLMETYRRFFGIYGVTVAQALLTNYDFTNRENFLNTKNVFELLLKKRVIPIVNENDVTTVAELKFGDNDMLSAKTAGMVSADALIIFTDVDGFFEENPRKNPHAKLISCVSKITDAVRAKADGAGSSGSRGGMITKLEAADYVASLGISMFIANGRRNILEKIIAFFEGANHGFAEMPLGLHEEEKLGTFFPAKPQKIETAKKWLRPKILKNAWIEVDAGCESALRRSGKSLLPSGITAVQGNFHRGDVVMIRGKNSEIAYGQTNYDSEYIDKIKKHRSDEIEAILGFSFEEEIIHRDRLVLVSGDSD